MTKSVSFSEPDPLLEEPIVVAVAEEAGFAVTPGTGAQTIRRPEDITGFSAQIGTRIRIDPSDLVIMEASVLDDSEQADARAALIADGVFEFEDWPSQYLDRDFSVGDSKSLRFDRSSLIRTGIKFGWALEQAARIVSASAKSCPRVARFEIVLDSPAPVTPEEHLFIGLELQRRGVQAFDLALPWGGRWEPAVEWIGDVEAFTQNLSIHSAIASHHGSWRLSFDHAEQKFEVLPVLSVQCGSALHLNVDGLGWMGATRIIARHEPDLLREMLIVAQDRFVFDKPNAELATTEDDIRSLPDVPDTELERVFVEDFRGRQLLRFTASSLLGHERLGPAFRAAVEGNRPSHSELVAVEARRHFAAWKA